MTNERETGGVRRTGRSTWTDADSASSHDCPAPCLGSGAYRVRCPGRGALAVGAGWPLLLVVRTALAPAPADPNAVPTFVDWAVFVAVMVGLVGTIVAAVARQSKALVWSTGLGVVWVATTIACPLSGHHPAVGWKWYTELVSGSGLLVLSLIGIHLLLRPRLSEVWART
jgi:hypothetical protein